MKLKVLSPYRVLLEKEVVRVVARGREGYFCILPRHVDYVSSLEPGPLIYDDEEGHSARIEVGEAMLIKIGDEVLVSSGAAEGDRAAGSPSGRAYPKSPEESERLAREAAARLEGAFTIRFLREREKD